MFDGKVVIGNSGADYGVRGFVAAWDAETGRKLWKFYTVPGNPADGPDGEASDSAMARALPSWHGEWWKYGGGGTAWDSLVYDPALKLVYIGTGNGAPLSWHFRSEGKGDNLFLCSIVAVDAETGQYKWHYQMVPEDDWDFTCTQPMMLAGTCGSRAARGRSSCRRSRTAISTCSTARPAGCSRPETSCRRAGPATST